jgi:Tol biopolymer transport system component
MSQGHGARGRAAMLVRVLRSLVLAAALVCASAPTTAGRVGVGRVVFEAGGAIYVMDAGGTPTQVVGARAGVSNMQPALSPDASRVAFSSNLEGEFSIYVVGVDGGGLRRLTDGPGDDSEPAWSPDGSRIAFVRGFDATGSGVVVLTCISPGDILTVGVDDGAAEVNLTQGAGGTDPAWSPDGKRIAFASDRAGSYDIYTMSSEDGRGVRRLTEDETAEADPSWSPDGAWIAYTGKLREDRATQCGNMPIVGGPTSGGGDDDGDEGDTLTLSGGPYVYRMTADGSEHKSLTDVGGAAEPDWSPDGSQIVFVGGRKTGEVHLYLIVSDGTGPWVQLTSDAAEESSPSWVGTIIR